MKSNLRPYRQGLRGSMPVLSLVLLVCLGFLVGQESRPLDGPGRESPSETPADSSADPLANPLAQRIQESWFRAATRNIDVLEYHASVGEEGLQAPNRAHNLRTYFLDAKVEVVPRIQGSGDWRWFWKTVSFGREGAIREVGPAEPASEGDRVEYERDSLIEWYVNSKAGLEQGFTIPSPPSGTGRLCIDANIMGDLRAQLVDGGGAVDFLDQGGARCLRYGKLAAFDANGEEIPSDLALSGNAIRIVVDDRDAAYPILVDPVLTSPAWFVVGESPDTKLGYCVAPAGDVNADGYSDIIVGAPFYDSSGEDRGAAYAYLGSPEGPSTSHDWHGEGDQDNAQYGFRVAPAGDVNGDGYHDVLVAAPLHTNGQDYEGRVVLHLGASYGIQDTWTWSAEGNQEWAWFGFSIAAAGDVNGDGYDDVLVGAPRITDDEFWEGAAYLYLGSSEGLEPTPVWATYGDQEQCAYGISVAGAGDVNGDGFADVLVGASMFTDDQDSEGRVYVYLGSGEGLSLTPVWHADGDQADCNFGYSVARCGDVNGDGYADIAVGAFEYDTGVSDAGRAYVYLGGPSGPEGPPWTYGGLSADEWVGLSVATAGDVNGDGLADLLVGAPGYDSESGRAYLFYGSRDGLGGEPGWTRNGDTSSRYGFCVATAGDANGDGFSDLLVGSPSIEDDSGAALLYLGSGDGPREAPGWVAESNQAHAHAGVVASAGDVDGDGYEDVLVGAEGYDFGQANEGVVFLFMGTPSGLSILPDWYAESNQAEAGFGHSVACAGDVNGDGYSDIVVGAHLYDAPLADEGAAFLWLGSPSGGPVGNPGNAAWSASGGQDGAYLGYAVASAGDVNGDGYSDVIVGIPRYTDAGEWQGAAAVYHGSESGLSPTHSWMDDGEAVGGQFGFSVASAGDINGDGYGDVLVGAPYYDVHLGPDDEGKVYLYGGTSGGLLNWGWSADGDEEDAYFGFSVASAGDVNGDGNSDILVGGPGFFGGGGMAFVWVYPCPGGCHAMDADCVVWGANGAAELGHAVASAGDVNGDGFSDIVVSAPFHLDFDTSTRSVGLVIVCPGCEDGVGPDCGGFEIWLEEGAQDMAKFGCSVASADVNGDGFSDILVGATDHDQGQEDEGRAFLYYGNNSRGLARMPSQMRTDHSAPIALLGLSNSSSGFGLRALGRTAAGRGRVRMEWEAKRFGTPFNAHTIPGETYDTGPPVEGLGSAVLLEEVVAGLSSETAYHWRLRIATGDPYFPRTTWLSPPGNGATELDLRTPGGSSRAQDVASGHDELRLESYPNPLSTQSTIRFGIPKPADVRIGIYDVQGRRVRILVDEHKSAGMHQVLWDGRGDGGRRVASGVYWVKLKTGELEVSRQILVTQ